MPKKSIFDEPTSVVKKPEAPKFKWRYFCEACTSPAMYGHTPGKFASVACQQCGKVQPYKPENWLPMSEEEIAKYN